MHAFVTSRLDICRLQLVSHLLLIYNYFEMLQPDY